MSLFARIRRYLAAAPASRGDGGNGGEDGDRTLYEQAWSDFSQGRLEPAETACRALLDKYPDDIDLLRLLGTVLGQSGRFEAAITVIARALAINPVDAVLHDVKGNCLRGLNRHAEALVCYDQAIALHSGDAATWLNRGAIHRDLGHVDQALTDFEHVLTVQPDHALAHGERANLLLYRQQFDAAAEGYRTVLRLTPDNNGARFSLAAALARLDRHEEALACYQQLLASDPANIGALANRAHLLEKLQRPAEALASLDEALRLCPGHPQLLVNRAAFLRERGRHDEALAVLDTVLSGAPQIAAAHYNRGVTLQSLEQHAAALDSFEQAVALAPDDAASLEAQAVSLHATGRNDEALAAADRALALQPSQTRLQRWRAQLLRRLRRPTEALAGFERTLALDPDDADSHFECARLLTDLVRPDDAIAAYGEVIARHPDHKDALFNRGYLLLYRRRNEAAQADWTRVAELDPHYPYIQGYLLRARMYNCDWIHTAPLVASIEDAVSRGERAIEPWIASATLTTPALLKRCAEIYCADRLPPPATRVPPAARQRRKRICVAYMAGEFREHAITYLTSELYERHDRDRFDVIAVDCGYDDGGPSRRRLERAIEEWIPISRLDDEQAAAMLRNRDIDILVDVNGYSGLRRTGVLNRRPAPLQVNWLGFAGTMGASFMDYLIADPVIIPPGGDGDYTENVVRLPDTYQPNDSHRAIADPAPTRGEAGLPPQGFVFCCFNDNYKIMPEVFDIWMRLLGRIPGSLLWLLDTGAGAMRNLRGEAERRGVAAHRLVFAPRLPMPAHLARQRLADLFLDTLPYNAHTTASDALWAGLPLLTCQGSAFAGRVAASLLLAAGLPELITQDAATYEALAYSLATDPGRLTGLRRKLAANRDHCALFDAGRYTRHIESAYLTMHERALRGEPPAGFDVAPLPSLPCNDTAITRQ